MRIPPPGELRDLVARELSEINKIMEEVLGNSTLQQSLADAGAILQEAFRNGNAVFTLGNGGSMCDAMHFAEELSGRYRHNRKPLPASAISDPSYLTCVANDYGYDEVFARYLRAHGRKGDVVCAFSTSGNSPNVLLAAAVAKEKGMHLIGFTGKNGGRLAGFCDIELRAPASEFADRAQEVHIKLVHILIRLVESGLTE